MRFPVRNSLRLDRTRRFGAIVFLLALVPAAPSLSMDVVVANGMPSDANPFSSVMSGARVWAQNVGCDFTIEEPCASPGAATGIEIADGASLAAAGARDSSHVRVTGGMLVLGTPHTLATYDEGTAVVEGGNVFRLGAHDDSSVAIEGGAVGYIVASQDATITISGGVVGTVFDPPGLAALDAATITLVGQDFEVDGASVPYGPIAAQSGVLSGTLASGEPIDPSAFVRFVHAGADGDLCAIFESPCTGAIVLQQGEVAQPVELLALSRSIETATLIVPQAGPEVTDSDEASLETPGGFDEVVDAESSWGEDPEDSIAQAMAQQDTQVVADGERITLSGSGSVEAYAGTGPVPADGTSQSGVFLRFALSQPQPFVLEISMLAELNTESPISAHDFGAAFELREEGGEVVAELSVSDDTADGVPDWDIDELEGVLGPGEYVLQLEASADAQADDGGGTDGDAWYGVAFSVPEPDPTFAISALVATIGWLRRRR